MSAYDALVAAGAPALPPRRFYRVSAATSFSEAAVSLWEVPEPNARGYVDPYALGREEILRAAGRTAVEDVAAAAKRLVERISYAHDFDSVKGDVGPGASLPTGRVAGPYFR